MKIDYCSCGMGVGALDILNTSLNVLNTGANVYSVIKSNNTSETPIQSSGQNVTVVNERQLTAQEIELLKEKHQQWVKSQELDRSLKMQQSADLRRWVDKDFRTPEQDHTTTYIVGGLLFFGLLIAVIKKK